MKKKNKGIGRIIRLVGLFFDKWLITPITKLILKLMEIFKSWAKAFDRLSNKKSTLLYHKSERIHLLCSVNPGLHSAEVPLRL